jgi:Ca2+-binding RTX toxin-like protein
MSTLSLSSQLGAVIQGLEQQLDSGDFSPSMHHGNYLEEFFDIVDVESSTVLQLSSTVLRFRYDGMDGAKYVLSLQGSGLSPVSSLTALEAAISQGIAKGSFSNLIVERLYGTSATKIFQVDFSKTGYKISSGTDVLTVSGNLPRSFGDLFKLNELLGQFDRITLSNMSIVERQKYFDSLASFNISGVDLRVAGTSVFSIGFTSNKFSLTIADFSLELAGAFPNDFGEIANAVFEAAINDDFDLNAFSGFRFDSVIVRRGEAVLMEWLNPTAAVSSFKVDSHTIVQVDGGPEITIGEAGYGLNVSFGQYEQYSQIVFGSINTTSGDYIFGGLGDDYVYGYAGGDELHGSFGDDLLDGGSGNDTLYGGNNNDKLYGGSGNDKSYGEAGNDSIYMDAGNDTLDGGTGTDWLYVTGGTNSVVDLAKTTGQNTGYGSDIIKNIENASGGSGVDKFHGTTGNNTLKGNNGNDLLYGRGGNDLLHGGNDNDKLYGDTGADSLTGGTGSDLLYGGADSARDVFIFNSVADSKIGSTRDKVYDFRTKVDDLDLRGIDANTRVSGNQEFSFSTTTAKANSVWYKTANLDGNATTKEIIVYGDVNGDAKADFEIGLMGVTSVVKDDFIL